MNNKIFILLNGFLNSLFLHLNIPFKEEKEVDIKLIDIEKFNEYLHSIDDWDKLKVLFFIKVGKDMHSNKFLQNEIHSLFLFLYNLNSSEFKDYILSMFNNNPYFYNNDIIRKKIKIFCTYKENE